MPESVPEISPETESRWIGRLSAVAIGMALITGGLAVSQLLHGERLLLGDRLPPLSSRYALFMRVVSGVTILSSVYLLVCAIGLHFHRRWVFMALWIWSIAEFFRSAVAGLLGYVAFDDAVERQTAQLDFMAGLGNALALLLILLGILWGWILPVFIFFWFGREKIRDEIRTW